MELGGTTLASTVGPGDVVVGVARGLAGASPTWTVTEVVAVVGAELPHATVPPTANTINAAAIALVDIPL